MRTELISRALGILREEGPRGLVRRSRGQLAFADEKHVWYELDLTVPPDVRLDEACDLVPIESGGPALELFDLVGSCDPALTRERLKVGGRAWLVVCAGDPAFGCWTFRGRTPVRAMPDDWLPLAPDVAGLEDSVTAPSFRGRGVAPRAWSQVANVLAAEGCRALVTKILDTNSASRRAVEKVGFRPVAESRLRRRGPHVALRATSTGGGFGPALAAAIDGRRRWLPPGHPGYGG